MSDKQLHKQREIDLYQGSLILYTLYIPQARPTIHCILTSGITNAFQSVLSGKVYYNACYGSGYHVLLNTTCYYHLCFVNSVGYTNWTLL